MRKAVQSRGRRSSPLDALMKLKWGATEADDGLKLKKEAIEADAEADAQAGTKDGTEKWHDDWNDEWHHEWQPGYVGYYYDDNGAETIDLEAEETQEDRQRKARRNMNRYFNKKRKEAVHYYDDNGAETIDYYDDATVHCENDTKRRKRKRKAVKTPEEGVEPQGDEAENATVHCENGTKRRKKKRKAMKTKDTRRGRLGPAHGYRSAARQTDQEAVGEAGEPQKTKKANGIHHGMVSIRAS